MENTNNVISIMDLINAQETTRRTRTSQFTEYTSKKKLEESQSLTKEQIAAISQIKNTFSFSLDKSHKYLIITLYNRTADKKYSFFILNLETMTGNSAESIKTAKETVLKLLGQTNVVVEEIKEAIDAAVEAEEQVATEPVAEEVVETAEEQTESAESEVVEETAKEEKSNKRNRSRKSTNK